MILRSLSLLVALAVSGPLLVSCGGPDADILLTSGNSEAANTKGEALFQRAKAADDAGKSSRAIKLYDQTATRYPAAPSSAQARYRQAQLLEQDGQTVKSFDAYQKFIIRYQGSRLYPTALSKQAAMAQAAAEGEVKSSFIGLKTKLPLDRTVDMLTKVRDNAPLSRTASRAQFTIGELYQGRKKPSEAVEAYRKLVNDQPDSPEAPEALFRTGVILTEEATRSSKNQATIDLAREAFNDFLVQYPSHSRNAEARNFIKTLGGMELERTFSVAEFYYKTGQLDSAKVYYRDIVRSTSSGEIHDASRARLKELGE